MRRRFLDQLISDARGWLILAGASILWQAALWIFATERTAVLMALLAWAPLALVPLWAMWEAGAMMHRRVLSDQTVPRASAGWAVLLVHLGIATVQALALAGLVSLGAWLVFRLTLGVPGLLDVLPIPDPGWVTEFGVRTGFLAFLIVPLLAAVTQTAYLVGRLVDGYRFALSLWAFILLSWISLRILPLLTEALLWLPDVALREVREIGPAFEFRTVYLETAPFAAFVLLAIVLAAATGPLLHHVESTRGLSLSEYEARSLRRA